MRSPWLQRLHPGARPRPRALHLRGRAAVGRDAGPRSTRSRRSCRDVRRVDAGQQSPSRHALDHDRSRSHPWDLFVQVSGQFENDIVRQQGVIRLEVAGPGHLLHVHPALQSRHDRAVARRRPLHGAGAHLGLQLHHEARGRRVRRRHAGLDDLRARDAGRHREVVRGARARGNRGCATSKRRDAAVHADGRSGKKTASSRR